MKPEAADRGRRRQRQWIGEQENRLLRPPAPRPGSKLDKAKELGVSVIDESEMEKIVEG